MIPVFVYNIFICPCSRLNFSTAFSTNAVSIFQSLGISGVTRVECSTRYLITFDAVNSASGDNFKLSTDIERDIVNALHDKMTQCRYFSPIVSFAVDVKPEPVFEVDVIEKGREALEKANAELGVVVLVIAIL